MGSLLIGIFTLILVVVCILLVLVILMQRPNANAGMGSALGGGAAESTFGGEAGNVLTRATVKLTVLFFVISAGLFLGYIFMSGQKDDTAPTTLTLSAQADKAAKAKPTSDIEKKAAQAQDAAKALEDAKKTSEKAPAPATKK